MARRWSIQKVAEPTGSPRVFPIGSDYYRHQRIRTGGLQLIHSARGSHNRVLNSEDFTEINGPINSCTGLASGSGDTDSGAPPPNPGPEEEDRCACEHDLLGEKPPERRRTRRSRRILLLLRRRVELLEFIDYEAGSFDCGEYAFAQSL